jgi:hypothetical protein
MYMHTRVIFAFSETDLISTLFHNTSNVFVSLTQTISDETQPVTCEIEFDTIRSSSLDFSTMASKSIGFKLLLFVGQISLAYIYGLFGSLLTILLFLRLGIRKFFKRVERPLPPTQALDSVHGKHDMIKLKVNMTREQ